MDPESDPDLVLTEPDPGGPENIRIIRNPEEKVKVLATRY
jgi:hypothetical protein